MVGILKKLSLLRRQLSGLEEGVAPHKSHATDQQEHKDTFVQDAPSSLLRESAAELRRPRLGIELAKKDDDDLMFLASGTIVRVPGVGPVGLRTKYNSTDRVFDVALRLPNHTVIRRQFQDEGQGKLIAKGQAYAFHPTGKRVAGFDLTESRNQLRLTHDEQDVLQLKIVDARDTTSLTMEPRLLLRENQEAIALPDPVLVEADFASVHAALSERTADRMFHIRHSNMRGSSRVRSTYFIELNNGDAITLEVNQDHHDQTFDPHRATLHRFDNGRDYELQTRKSGSNITMTGAGYTVLFNVKWSSGANGSIPVIDANHVDVRSAPPLQLASEVTAAGNVFELDLSRGVHLVPTEASHQVMLQRGLEEGALTSLELTGNIGEWAVTADAPLFISGHMQQGRMIPAATHGTMEQVSNVYLDAQHSLQCVIERTDDAPHDFALRVVAMINSETGYRQHIVDAPAVPLTYVGAGFGVGTSPDAMRDAVSQLYHVASADTTAFGGAAWETASSTILHEFARIVPSLIHQGGGESVAVSGGDADAPQYVRLELDAERRLYFHRDVSDRGAQYRLLNVEGDEASQLLLARAGERQDVLVGVQHASGVFTKIPSWSGLVVGGEGAVSLPHAPGVQLQRLANGDIALHVEHSGPNDALSGTLSPFGAEQLGSLHYRLSNGHHLMIRFPDEIDSDIVRIGLMHTHELAELSDAQLEGVEVNLEGHEVRRGAITLQQTAYGQVWLWPTDGDARVLELNLPKHGGEPVLELSTVLSQSELTPGAVLAPVTAASASTPTSTSTPESTTTVQRPRFRIVTPSTMQGDLSDLRWTSSVDGDFLLPLRGARSLMRRDSKTGAVTMSFSGTLHTKTIRGRRITSEAEVRRFSRRDRAIFFEWDVAIPMRAERGRWVPGGGEGASENGDQFQIAITRRVPITNRHGKVVDHHHVPKQQYPATLVRDGDSWSIELAPGKRLVPFRSAYEAADGSEHMTPDFAFGFNEVRPAAEDMLSLISRVTKARPAAAAPAPAAVDTIPATMHGMHNVHVRPTFGDVLYRGTLRGLNEGGVYQFEMRPGYSQRLPEGDRYFSDLRVLDMHGSTAARVVLQHHDAGAATPVAVYHRGQRIDTQRMSTEALADGQRVMRAFVPGTATRDAARVVTSWSYDRRTFVPREMAFDTERVQFNGVAVDPSSWTPAFVTQSREGQSIAMTIRRPADRTQRRVGNAGTPTPLGEGQYVLPSAGDRRNMALGVRQLGAPSTAEPSHYDIPIRLQNAGAPDIQLVVPMQFNERTGAYEVRTAVHDGRAFASITVNDHGDVAFPVETRDRGRSQAIVLRDDGSEDGALLVSNFAVRVAAEDNTPTQRPVPVFYHKVSYGRMRSQLRAAGETSVEQVFETTVDAQGRGAVRVIGDRGQQYDIPVHLLPDPYRAERSNVVVRGLAQRVDPDGTQFPTTTRYFPSTKMPAIVEVNRETTFSIRATPEGRVMVQRTLPGAEGLHAVGRQRRAVEFVPNNGQGSFQRRGLLLYDYEPTDLSEQRAESRAKNAARDASNVSRNVVDANILDQFHFVFADHGASYLRLDGVGTWAFDTDAGQYGRLQNGARRSVVLGGYAYVELTSGEYIGVPLNGQSRKLRVASHGPAMPPELASIPASQWSELALDVTQFDVPSPQVPSWAAQGQAHAPDVPAPEPEPAGPAPETTRGNAGSSSHTHSGLQLSQRVAQQFYSDPEKRNAVRTALAEALGMPPQLLWWDEEVDDEGIPRGNTVGSTGDGTVSEYVFGVGKLKSVIYDQLTIRRRIVEGTGDRHVMASLKDVEVPVSAFEHAGHRVYMLHGPLHGVALLDSAQAKGGALIEVSDPRVLDGAATALGARMSFRVRQTRLRRPAKVHTGRREPWAYPQFADNPALASMLGAHTKRQALWRFRDVGLLPQSQAHQDAIAARLGIGEIQESPGASPLDALVSMLESGEPHARVAVGHILQLLAIDQLAPERLDEVLAGDSAHAVDTVAPLVAEHFTERLPVFPAVNGTMSYQHDLLDQVPPAPELARRSASGVLRRENAVPAVAAAHEGPEAQTVVVSEPAVDPAQATLTDRWELQQMPVDHVEMMLRDTDSELYQRMRKELGATLTTAEFMGSIVARVATDLETTPETVLAMVEDVEAVQVRKLHIAEQISLMALLRSASPKRRGGLMPPVVRMDHANYAALRNQMRAVLRTHAASGAARVRAQLPAGAANLRAQQIRALSSLVPKKLL